MSKDLDFSLKVAADKKQYLYPVLLAPDGTIVDGVHRRKADPNWPAQTVEVNSEVDRLIARLQANAVRRVMPKFEKAELLNRIAELTGWKPFELATNIGIPYKTVIRLIQPEYKERVKPAKVKPKLKPEEKWLLLCDYYPEEAVVAVGRMAGTNDYTKLKLLMRRFFSVLYGLAGSKLQLEAYQQSIQ